MQLSYIETGPQFLLGDGVLFSFTLPPYAVLISAHPAQTNLSPSPSRGLRSFSQKIRSRLSINEKVDLMAKRKTISKSASSKCAPRHEPTGAVFGKRCKKQHIAASRALKKVGIGVAFCGSSRTTPGDPYFDLNVAAARAVAALGVPIYHGGGPGNMLASALGTRAGGGHSVALCLHLGRKDEVSGPADTVVWFDDFSARIDTFRRWGQLGMVFFPGGIGTLHEATSTLDNIMQSKAPERPLIFFEPDASRPYWTGFVAWLKACAVANGMLRQSDLDRIKIVTTVQDLVAEIAAHMALHPRRI
jgi:uncharacterized protein (TIGR00730 family)